MPTRYYNFPWFGGMNRSIVESRTDMNSFYSLHNLRHNPLVTGRIEQTPSWYEYKQLTQSTYYDTAGAASATEPTGSVVTHLVKPGQSSVVYAITQYAIRKADDTAQVQVFYQSAVPSTATINGYCLLVINSVSGLALTLGSTVDIEIDAAATFRWRKNGGAWTAGAACSTSGTSIDSGNATVYFLTSSGFTVTDTWSWQRVDASSYAPATAPAASSTRPFVQYKQKVYFVAGDGQIMALQPDSSNAYYGISVGYRPVYGLSLNVFDDHLIVGGYQTSAYTSFASPTGVVANSDKSDLDNFWSTTDNEADTFTVPTNTTFASGGNGVKGLAVVRNQLYVVTVSELWTTPSYGYPVVFSYEKVRELRGVDNVYQSADGAYISTDNGRLMFFNGVDVSAADDAYVASLTANTQTIAGYTFHPVDLEHIFLETSVKRLYAIPARGQVYSRSVDLPSAAACLAALLSPAGTSWVLWIGAASRKIYVEDRTYAQTPVSLTDGTPKLITQLFSGQGPHVGKDLTGAFISADVSTVSVGAGYYSGSDVKIDVNYFTPDSGVISGNSTTGQTWTSATAQSFVGIRAPFRYLALELSITGTDNAKPPGGVILTGLLLEGCNLETPEMIKK
jgi:hypothetical protein